jgi:hypothetical protein
MYREHAVSLQSKKAKEQLDSYHLTNILVSGSIKHCHRCGIAGATMRLLATMLTYTTTLENSSILASKMEDKAHDLLIHYYRYMLEKVAHVCAMVCVQSYSRQLCSNRPR